MQCFEIELGGRKLTIEQGKMAKQANGAVLVRYGDTVVLVTATASSATVATVPARRMPSSNSDPATGTASTTNAAPDAPPATSSVLCTPSR